MNAQDVDIAYRNWLKECLKSTATEQSVLAKSWDLDRTAVSKVFSGVKRLHVVKVFQAYDLFGIDPPGAKVVHRPQDYEIDTLYSMWFTENFERKGDKTDLAKVWGTDRATVSMAASGRRPLTIAEAISAAILFKSNPPGLELDGIKVAGSRTGEKIAAGIVRAPDRRSEVPYRVEPDPEFPDADLICYPVAGADMAGRKPRPIIPGDIVVGVQLKDIRGQRKSVVVDGSLVVVRTEIAPGMFEWSLRKVTWEAHGVVLSCEPQRKRFDHLYMSNLSESGPIKVLALVRRVISKV